VVFGNKTGNFAVVGDTPEFRWVEPMALRKGRFLNPLDLQDARKVALIGDQAREVLFGQKTPIGSYVKIQGVYFQIVGEIFSDKGGDDGDRVRSTLFVPFSTFQRAFNQRDRVGWFSLTAHSWAPAEDVEKAVRRTLAARHNVHPDDEQAIGSFNAAEKVAQVEGLFRGIQLFIWLVGTLTLLAGVLGVSNILLITVKERTREIGIRKALGATPGRIIAMVLRESIILTSFAGYIGVVAGVGVLGLLERIVAALPEAPLNRPEVDLRAALVATAVLIVSGAVAGIIPARHAARISPVAALRSE
jgi:putative ABC transport system permease protein